MTGRCPTLADCEKGAPCLIASGCVNDPRTVNAARRLAAVRALYVEWSCSRNPVLLAAAGQIRQAAGFSLTDDEIARARREQEGMRS